MQNTSPLYRSIMSDDNHWFETKLAINGTTYTEDKIFSVSTTFAMFDANPEIGKAVAGEIDLTILMPDVEIPRMATVIPYVRVCANIEIPTDVEMDGDYLDISSVAHMEDDIVVFDDSVSIRDGIVYFEGQSERADSEWIQKGVYYIDTREVTHNDDGLDILTLHGYDAMLFTEQEFSESVREWPAGGVVDTDVVSDIASVIGVDVDDRTWDVMVDENYLTLPVGYSLREILGYIASMYLGSFIMTDAGKLRLVSLLELPPETNYLVDNIGYAITFGGDRILV